ncbi:MAG: peptidylprolyl isomerase [Solirubrobacterales bacterium]
MRTRTALVIALVTACGAISACGGGDDEDDAGVALPEGCESVEEPAAKDVKLDRPKRFEAPPSGEVAVVETSCGSFEIELDTASSPKTTASFARLVEAGLYDGTAFHRIVPEFVIQGGDPLGDGTGGPGYFVDEPPPNDVEYTKGTVAMAKTEVEPPGRSGSQFFVVVAADAGLPTDFAVLGEVNSGLDVVQRIAALGDPAAGQEGAPLAPVVIEGITLR